jgi:hypothetical protein
MGHLGRCAAGGALDDALRALARIDSRKVQVELHFFGGPSVEETAEVLKVSAVTVTRSWAPPGCGFLAR